MQNKVQVFENEMLGAVRVKGDFENPLFCLADICKILSITNPMNVKNSINREFDKGDMFNIYPLQTAGGKQNFLFINEPELYFVLMRSRSARAKPFRQWVVSEILPKIRKTGNYSPNDYINELVSLLMPKLPPYDFSIKVNVNDWNNKKEFSLHYEVGNAKAKSELLNTKFVEEKEKQCEVISKNL